MQYETCEYISFLSEVPDFAQPTCHTDEQGHQYTKYINTFIRYSTDLHSLLLYGSSLLSLGVNACKFSAVHRHTDESSCFEQNSVMVCIIFSTYYYFPASPPGSICKLNIKMPSGVL